MRAYILYRRITAAAAAVLISAAMTFTSFASAVSYTSHGGFTITIDSAGTVGSSDLFGPEFKALMPGDHVEKQIHVDNQYKGVPSVRLYMRAVPHSEANIPEIRTPEGESAEGDAAGGKTAEDIPTMEEFLAQLSMKIYNGSKLIFEASPDKPAQLTEYVSLGQFVRNGKGEDLTVVLDVPAELDNRFARRSGEVDWQFMVEEIEPGPGPSPSPGPGPGSKTKPAPAAPQPVADPVPKTGDEEHLAVWILAAAFAFVLIGVLLAKIKNTEQRINDIESIQKDLRGEAASNKTVSKHC